MSKAFDIVVVGGGHAGCEAALAAARMGVRTALVTGSRSSIARMPCNPSIGGIAKSHLVFELDALGGEVAKNTDYTGVQFRVLNTRKGPAVQANRAQCDKDRYSERMQAVLASTPNLEIIEDLAVAVLIEKGKAAGVRMRRNGDLRSRAVVLTPGTFLNGIIHIGKKKVPGGRLDEEAAADLGDSLKALGFRMARLKTGTPPRLAKDSLNYDEMDMQPGMQGFMP